MFDSSPLLLEHHSGHVCHAPGHLPQPWLVRHPKTGGLRHGLPQHPPHVDLGARAGSESSHRLGCGRCKKGTWFSVLPGQAAPSGSPGPMWGFQGPDVMKNQHLFSSHLLDISQRFTSENLHSKLNSWLRVNHCLCIVSQSCHSGHGIALIRKVSGLDDGLGPLWEQSPLVCLFIWIYNHLQHHLH